jgi:hypothetical protein
LSTGNGLEAPILVAGQGDHHLTIEMGQRGHDSTVALRVTVVDPDPTGMTRENVVIPTTAWR